MTDEQIKQNAIKAATKFKDWYHPQMSFYDGYIAGAHSLDEEIKELQKLRNPWISVKEHPDDVTKDYLLEYEDGSHIIAMWDSGMWMSKDLHPLKNPVRWMLIPN